MAAEQKSKSEIPDNLEQCIGQRIEVDKFRGTIRYVGPVATSKKATTTWLGIEWDDPNRGKNDGSVKTPDGTVTHNLYPIRTVYIPPNLQTKTRYIDIS